MSHKLLSLSFVLAVIFLPQTVLSQDRAEVAALSGLSQLKVYFDVKAETAPKLEKRLQWINDAYAQATGQGLKAVFVVSFRSRASFLVTKGTEYIDEDEIPLKANIDKWIADFQTRGITMEQCGLTAELFDIEKEEFLDGIRVVQNGYVSIAGYQNRGYAYVPM